MTAVARTAKYRASAVGNTSNLKASMPAVVAGAAALASQSARAHWLVNRRTAQRRRARELKPENSVNDLAEARSAQELAQLQQRIASVDINIVHLRKQGMIMAFDVQTQNPNFPRDCYSQALVHGLLIRPIGNTVYFMPPYIISESEIDFMLETALSVVAASM